MPTKIETLVHVAGLLSGTEILQRKVHSGGLTFNSAIARAIDGTEQNAGNVLARLASELEQVAVKPQHLDAVAKAQKIISDLL